MKHSESLAAIGAALAAAQAEMQSVAKDSTNPHFKSKFASLDTIIESMRPVLALHGLCISQSAEPRDGNAIVVETMVLHKSGEWLSNSVLVPLAKVDPQGAGAALTYGRRFGLSAVLCVATDEDDDGNTASRPAARRAERPPVRPTASTEASAPKDAASAPTADENKRFDGKRLGDYDSTDLRKIVNKYQNSEEHKALVGACRRIMTDRALGTTDDAKVERMKASVAAENAELPFT